MIEGNIYKIFKAGRQSGSSGRVPTLQAQGPEFKRQNCLKQNPKRLKNIFKAVAPDK
jgi:hypothetical protein